MFSSKALARGYIPLTVADVTVHLPIRKTVAQNISAQLNDGVPYEFPDTEWETLDILLNSALERKYQAPSPAQLRLVSVICSKLDIEPDEEELRYRKQTESFIDLYLAAMREVERLELEERLGEK